jgi:hypothetical protein
MPCGHGRRAWPAAGGRRHRAVMRPDDRRIACRDLTDRRLELIVFSVGDRLVLVLPAGATAVLDWRQVGQLRAALRREVTA